VVGTGEGGCEVLEGLLGVHGGIFDECWIWYTVDEVVLILEGILSEYFGK